MDDIMISWFNNCKSTVSNEISLMDWLTGDSYRKQVEVIRKTENKEQRSLLKQNLPCATLSGLFSVRKASGLIKHSGYLCIDIDGSDNPHISDFEKLRNQFSKIINVAYAGLSVSGKGVFCLIPILYPEKHKEHFEAFKADFESLGIIIDKSCGDITRLRFYSFDEKAYFNKNAVEYVKYIERNEKKKNFHKKMLYTNKLKNSSSNNPSQRVESILLKIESTGIDITGSYNQWFQIGCALANEFGEDGREMFHRVSQYSDKYIDTKTDAQFDKCLASKYSYKIGTFFHHAEECFKGVQ
jgi:hypothetical protein